MLRCSRQLQHGWGCRSDVGRPFARCTRCGAACGVMPFADARAGGWLAVLDHACGCGASVDELASATEEEIRHATPSGAALGLVLVPDG